MPSSGVQTCALDRKSTRLNSSHTIISYAVFCLQKKNHQGRDHHASDHLPPRCAADAVATPAPPPVPVHSSRAGPVCGPGLPCVVFFFFNNTAPPEIYPLPLPDPLPI